jgi:L-aspartate oxidase
VACTGVHGANRLASNSLLEGVVFGARAARSMREWASAEVLPESAGAETQFPSASREEIRTLAWEKCGVVRSGADLRAACRKLSAVGSGGPADYEARSIWQVASLIARCALAREESRGAHFRTDFPDKAAKARHSVVSR